MAEEKYQNEDFLAQWLANEISDQELIKLVGEKEFGVFKDLRDSTEKLSFPAYDTEAELTKLQQKLNATPQAKHIQFHFVRYAAAAVILIGIALVYYLTLPNYVVHKANFGETAEVLLPDGSTVMLAANSELKYIEEDYNKTERHLLLSGQAFFDVEKGNSFEVSTDQGDVKVLGTTFNVDQRNRILNVVCYTGKVAVQGKEKQRILTPGTGVRFQEGVINLEWNTDNSTPRWLNGITEINESNLASAVEALKNIYGIEVNSAIALEDIPYDGAFPHDNIDIALQSILGTENISYTYQEDQKLLVISEKK